MGGGRRVVGPREFGAGRQPQAARHRRDDIALLVVEHRARETGAVARGVVHVVAALDEERQLVAEPLARTRRAHGPSATTASRACAGPEAVATRQPSPSGAKRARVALGQHAAAPHEQREIGGGQRGGVGRRQGVGEMHAADGDLAEMRLQREQRVAVEQAGVDAERARLLGFLQAARLDRARCGTP